MDNALLVRVLERMADVDEELEAVARRQVVRIAVLADRNPAHQLHDEVRPPRLGRARVKDLRDPRVIHHRQRLALGLEARDHFACVSMPGLMIFERHFATEPGAGLLSHVDHAKAAFADLLQQLEVPDQRTGSLADLRGLG